MRTSASSSHKAGFSPPRVLKVLNALRSQPPTSSVSSLSYLDQSGWLCTVIIDLPFQIRWILATMIIYKVWRANCKFFRVRTRLILVQYRTSSPATRSFQTHITLSRRKTQSTKLTVRKSPVAAKTSTLAPILPPKKPMKESTRAASRSLMLSMAFGCNSWVTRHLAHGHLGQRRTT